MKPIVRWIALVLLLVGIGVAAAYYSGAFDELIPGTGEVGIAYYTCPMHPQIHEDHPGNCPICGMKLVPVRTEAAPNLAGNAGAQAETGSAGGVAADSGGENAPLRINGVVISTARQQLIGLKTTVLTRRRAHMTIRTTGRVAFDPELGVAIQEYLSAYGDPGLRRAAESRLKLLGMGAEEIRRLPARARDYESLYAFKPGATLWIYATLFEGELEAVRPGMRARIQSSYAADGELSGVVRSLSPVVDAATRSVRARIEVPPGRTQLRPDSFVNVEIQADLGEQLLLPRSGLIDTGVRRVAFVVDDAQRFTARDLVLGPEAGDDVVVLSGLNAGERVVTSAAFMVDAESQLKSAAEAMQERDP